MTHEVKPQARVKIYEGMSVETVKKNGSEGQKLMAPLFDVNHDGKYDGNEAAAFDSYNFKTEKGKITMYNRSECGAEITELIYDDYEKDILNQYKGEALNSPDSFTFYNDKGEFCHFGTIGDFAKVVIDMIKGKVHVEGGNKGAYNLFANNVELTVKNSDLGEISVSGGKINLQNVKDKGLLWDSATEIQTDGETIVNADKNSKVEVTIKEDEE